jgi:hypothetical protein
MKSRLSISLLLLLIVCAESSAQVECVDYSGTAPLLGYQPIEYVTRYVASGSLIYALETEDYRPYLRVFEVNDTPGLNKLGQVELFAPGKLWLDGGRAIVWDPPSITAIDISDSTNPRLEFRTPFLKEPSHVLIDESYMYAAFGDDQLRIYNISDPEHPVLISSVLIEGDKLIKLFRWDGYLVANLQYGLAVLDVSDPEAPFVYGRLPALATGVSIGGRIDDYAISSTNREIAVIDLSDLAQPVLSNVYTDENFINCRAFNMKGDEGLVADYKMGVHVLDLSALPDVTREYTMAFCQEPSQAVLVNDMAVVTLGYRDLWFVDYQAHQAVDPTPLISAEFPATLDVMESDSEVIYGIAGGLVIFEYGENNSFVEIGSVPYRTNNAIEVTEGVAYLGSSSYEWAAVDITERSRPRAIAIVPAPGRVYGFALDDQVLYTAGYQQLTAYDVVDPASPILLTSSPGLVGYIEDIDVVENVIYVATRESFTAMSVQPDYEILDELPLAGKVMIPGNAQGVDIMYVLSDRGLFTIDISDPRMLLVMDSISCPITFNFRSMDIRDGIAYVSLQNGILLYDVSDPADLSMLGFMPVPSFYRDHVICGDVLVSSFYPQGLAAFGLHCLPTVGTFPNPDDDPVDTNPPSPLSMLSISPNPFNPLTTITFNQVKPGPVSVCIHDLTGRMVSRLYSGYVGSVSQSLEWAGRDDDGRMLPSGSYIVRMQGEADVVSKKIMLLR